MSPSLKRYLPLLLLGAVVAGGIYATSGRKLTGEAGAVHQEGGLAQLGQVDNTLLTQLDQLVPIKALPGASSPNLTKAKAVTDSIAAQGKGALASVASHFRDNGCVQPGSAVLAELLGRLAKDEAVTPVERRLVSAVLLDAAAHGAEWLKVGRPDKSAFSKRPDLNQLVESVREGTWNGELPADNSINFEESDIIWDCTVRSLRIVGDMLREGVVDSKALYQTARASVESLPSDHIASLEFVRVTLLAANASKQPTTEIVSLAARSTLAPKARALACQAAVAQKASVENLRAATGPKPDRVLLGCLIDAGDQAAIDEALSSEDPGLRMTGMAAKKITSDGDFAEKLAELYEVEVSPRERSLRAGLLAEYVEKSDAPDPLVAPVDGLHAKHPDGIATRALARAMLSRNPQKPKLARAPEGDGSLAASLGKLAKGSGTVAVAQGLVVDVKSIKDRVPGEAAGPDLTLAEEQGAPPYCDIVVDPGEAQQVIDDATGKIGPMGTICARPGMYTGTLEVRTPGIRIMAIGEGSPVLTGGLLVAASTAMIGFQIKGPAVISQAAVGTKLLRCGLDGGAVSATQQVTFHANKLGSDKKLIVPGGTADPAGHQPGSDKLDVISLNPGVWPPG